MRDKVNKLRNEIVNKIESLIEKLPGKTILLYKDLMELAEGDNVPYFYGGIKNTEFAEIYCIQAVSLNEDGVLQFHGINEETCIKKVEESDWIYIEKLLRTLEVIEEVIANPNPNEDE